MKFYRTMPAGLKVYYRQQLENYRSEMSKANLQLLVEVLKGGVPGGGLKIFFFSNFLMVWGLEEEFNITC